MKNLKINVKFTALVIASALVVTSCANKETSSQYQDSSDKSDVLDNNISKIEDQDIKPAVKSIDLSAESAINAAIKKQTDNDIVKAANDLLIVNPTNLKALNALGLSNYKKGKYKAAEYFFSKAIKANPTEAGLFNNFALVKLAQNEPRDAVKLLKQGLAQKPSDMALLTNLGSIYATQKDYANAALVLETVYKSGNKDLKASINYALSLAATKKNAEASQVYEKLLSENASSRDVMLNYSIHLIENVQNNKQGLDLINRLKFVGIPDDARNVIKELENKAKAGLK